MLKSYKLVSSHQPKLRFQLLVAKFRTSVSLQLHFNTEESKASGTMAEVKEKIDNILGLKPGYNPNGTSREHLLKYTPKKEDLPKRNMRDSYINAIIPLKTDNILQDKYVNLIGKVRMGRIMEDIDLFAVWVSHNYVLIPNLPEGVHLPYTFVTIMVDKIHFTEYRPVFNEDIRLFGHVTWVGTSSMEVFVWLDQKHDDCYEHITRAVFLIAARNATNTGSAPFNPLELTSDVERQINNEAIERKKQRERSQKESIFKVEPNFEELSLIHHMFKRLIPVNTNQFNLQVLPENCRYMSDSISVNTITAFPENRNAQYTVFGGFIMRTALEISWLNACIYSKSRPRLLHISDISFHHPVHVGDCIKMTSFVVYTEGNLMQLMTVVETADITFIDQKTTNLFYSILSANQTVSEVMPHSYQETLFFIQGRRIFQAITGNEKNDNHQPRPPT